MIGLFNSHVCSNHRFFLFYSNRLSFRIKNRLTTEDSVPSSAPTEEGKENAVDTPSIPPMVDAHPSPVKHHFDKIENDDSSSYGAVTAVADEDEAMSSLCARLAAVEMLIEQADSTEHRLQRQLGRYLTSEHSTAGKTCKDSTVSPVCTCSFIRLSLPRHPFIFILYRLHLLVVFSHRQDLVHCSATYPWSISCVPRCVLTKRLAFRMLCFEPVYMFVVVVVTV